MRSVYAIRCMAVVFLTAAGLWAAEVWAADPAAVPETVFGTSLPRVTWDLIMRWINFIILAGLIIKYARAPLMEFLNGEKAKTARTIGQVEEKKRLAEEKIREGQIKLKASEERLSLIQDRIVAEGKKRREQMIVEAEDESRLMLSAARMRIDSQIRDAYESIRSEMIDTAVEKAMAKLPLAMTAADHEQWIATWVNQAQGLADT